MIASFANKATESVFKRQFARRWPQEVSKIGYRKLVQIHAAVNLKDLGSPPGNQLEALKGDRKGQHSIRINDQWRVCFVWKDGNAERVEIVDYH